MAFGGIGHSIRKSKVFNKLILFLIFLFKFFRQNCAYSSAAMVTSGDLAVDRGNTLATTL